MFKTSINGFEDATDTMMEVFENGDGTKYDPDLDATNAEDCCTYTKSLQRPPAKRPRLTLDDPQTLYLCLTCCPEIRKLLEQCAQVCSACSYRCHESHQLIEWYTKRNLLCDCPTERIPKAKCALKEPLLQNGKSTKKKPIILNSTRKRPHPDQEGEPDPGSDCGNQNSELPEDLAIVNQTKQNTSNYPHYLIGLMYRLDLSVLCLIRKLRYEQKYPSLSFEFENNECDKFNHIILRHNEKSIYVQIENVDKFKDSDLSYATLFGKDKRCGSLRSCFDSFVRCLLRTDSSVNNIDYLLVYTNSGLELTEQNQLKQRKFKDFYPFPLFIRTKSDDVDILNQFFFTNDSAKFRNFYQFSSDQTAREELFKRIEVSSTLLKDLEAQKLSPDELKNQFFDRLVFAVNQPSREELSTIVKKELKLYGNGQVKYSDLQEDVLSHITIPAEVFFELNLLTVLLNQMYIYKKIVSIKSERQPLDMSNDVTIRLKKNKIIYLKAISPSNNKLTYTNLFAKRLDKGNLNKLFSAFIEKYNQDLKYFVIYTHAELNVTKTMRLKRTSKSANIPLKFEPVNVQQKDYKLFRKMSFISESGFYKFSARKSTRSGIQDLLKLPNDLQREKDAGKLSAREENALKNSFIDKLLFVTNQANNKKLRKLVKNDIKYYEVPYNCEELNEIALRWSESRDLGAISLEVLEKLLDDIKNNRFHDQKSEKLIQEESKFARIVAGKEGKIGYEKLLELLVKDERIQFFKNKGISPLHFSSIISGSGDANATAAFSELFDLWFDENGCKTHYLVNLEKKAVDLENFVAILNQSGPNGAKNFKSLYDLIFDANGDKTPYLTNLEAEGISLSHMSRILAGSGDNATKAFKDLYDLCFDEQGNRVKYLKSFEKEGVNLVIVSNILYGVRGSAAKAFKDLYDMWFDEHGNKKQNLIVLQEEGVEASTALRVLYGARSNAAKTFNDLYDLWFDKEGNPTQFLRNLKENGLHLTCILNVLSNSGNGAVKAFKELYDLCFYKVINKMHYLNTLESNYVSLRIIFGILYGAGTNAAKAFKELYDLWFDEEGNRTQYLKALQEKGVSLTTICFVLNQTGANAGKAFKELYNTLFDDKGNKIVFLKALEENGVNLTSICTILNGSGAKASKAFQELYDLWFDGTGKTHYLRALEEQGIHLPSMSNILCGAGAKAPQAFKDLYSTFFDEKGDKNDFLKVLDENKINLNNLSSILCGSGADVSKAFKELSSTFIDEQGHKNQHLEHFIETKDGEKGFKLQNLSSILNKTGSMAARDAFERLHDVCFDENGEKTEIIENFYRAGFKPNNLATLLNGTGIHAAFGLKRFYSICFDADGFETNVLKDFLNAGFSASNLCSLLSGSPNTLTALHEFCFVRETKMYLEHFLSDSDGFTPGYLSKILQGSGIDICFVLKDFHDVCYYNSGSRTELIEEFFSTGFKSRDLANILAMTGNRVVFVLKSFHNLCFGYESYLKHLLAEDELFSPKNLSKILTGVGVNVCPSFQKLYSLCFDAEGNKTKYLRKLRKNNTLPEIVDILQEKVKTATYSFSDDVSFKEEQIKNESESC